MSTLRTDYQDDVFTGSRKYHMIDNGDGTVSFEDVTQYTQQGDTYGAAQINEVNTILNGMNGNVYKADDSAETSIENADYFPYFDSSEQTTKKSLWSNIITVLKNTFAIKNHASTNKDTYGGASTTRYGHVKTTTSYTSYPDANEPNVLHALGAYRLYKEFEDELTANNNRIYLDYYQGQYGYNTDKDRGTSTFRPFSSYTGDVVSNQVDMQHEGTYDLSHTVSVAGNYLLITHSHADLSDGGQHTVNSITGFSSTYLTQTFGCFNGDFVLKIGRVSAGTTITANCTCIGHDRSMGFLLIKFT